MSPYLLPTAFRREPTKDSHRLSQIFRNLIALTQFVGALSLPFEAESATAP